MNGQCDQKDPPNSQANARQKAKPVPLGGKRVREEVVFSPIHGVQLAFRLFRVLSRRGNVSTW